jgi:hypothetical protein
VTIDEYLDGKNADGVALFRRFQVLVEACGPSDAAVSRTVVYFRRSRVFAGGFVTGRRLELVIDLLRTADHHVWSARSPRRSASSRIA